MFKGIRQHPVIVGFVAVAGFFVAATAYLATLWPVFFKDTVLDVLARRDVQVTAPSVYGALVIALGFVVIVLQLVLIRTVRVGLASRLPYPTVRIFRHKEARKHSDAVFHQIHDRFTEAGWRVEGSNTDLPQHDNGIRLAGRSGYEREAAKWGLQALGIEWIPDERPSPPEVLEIIVGRYENKAERERSGPLVSGSHEWRPADANESRGKLEIRFETAGAYRRFHHPRTHIRFGVYNDSDIAVDNLEVSLIEIQPQPSWQSLNLDLPYSVRWADLNAQNGSHRINPRTDVLFDILWFWKPSEAVAGYDLMVDGIDTKRLPPTIPAYTDLKAAIGVRDGEHWHMTYRITAANADSKQAVFFVERVGGEMRATRIT